jgi:hypothetical protein
LLYLLYTMKIMVIQLPALEEWVKINLRSRSSRLVKAKALAGAGPLAIHGKREYSESNE